MPPQVPEGAPHGIQPAVEKGRADAYKPVYVAGDFAMRTDITPHPDAVPLADFKAWPIDPTKTAAARAVVGDLILTLQ